MLPSEMVILMAIAIHRNTSEKLLTRSMDITGEYIGYLYHSLVKRGYLKMCSSSNYKLTTKGREAVFEFMNKNKTRAKDVMKRLKLLGISIGPGQEQMMDQLEKEAVKGR